MDDTANGDMFAWAMIKEGSRWFVVRYGPAIVFLGLIAWLGFQYLLARD